jgi:mannitol-specific phosphotransferase system IIBC component
LNELSEEGEKMKNITIILTVVTFAAGVQIAQADVTDENHTHRGSLFQSISASDRLNFRDENHNNMELMSTQERQEFMNNMNSGMSQNSMGNSDMRNKMQSMSTEDRQAFKDQMQSMSSQDRQAFRESMGGGQGGSVGMSRGSMGGMGGMSRGGMGGGRGR